jgi:cell division ATPase FtsA|nr:MAG TPA: protein of unknown function (DUF1707) [Caudoviricetes sp.]
MKTITEIINAYAHGELTLEECNRRLKELGSAPLRDPLEPKITPEMAKQGYCLLDTGTGSYDVVQVRDGQLVDSDMGEMAANVLLKGKWYEVKGKKVIF